MHNIGMRFVAAVILSLAASHVADAASVPDLLQNLNSLASKETPVYAVDTRLRVADALRALYPELRHQTIEDAWNAFRMVEESQKAPVAQRMFEAYYGYDPEQARSVLEPKAAPDETARIERANALDGKIRDTSLRRDGAAALAADLKTVCAQASAPELVRRCFDLYTALGARLYRLGAAPPEDPSLRSRFEIARLIEVADVASDFSARDLTGRPLTLSSLKGKVVVLAFWASWCQPCHAELPILERISTDGEAVVVGVNSELADIASRFFIDQFGYTFPSLIDEQSRISRQYGVSALPVTIIINREGRLTQRINGFQAGGGTDLEVAIQRALRR